MINECLTALCYMEKKENLKNTSRKGVSAQ